MQSMDEENNTPIQMIIVTDDNPIGCLRYYISPLKPVDILEGLLQENAHHYNALDWMMMVGRDSLGLLRIVVSDLLLKEGGIEALGKLASRYIGSRREMTDGRRRFVYGEAFAKTLTNIAAELEDPKKELVLGLLVAAKEQPARRNIPTSHGKSQPPNPAYAGFKPEFPQA